MVSNTSSDATFSSRGQPTGTEGLWTVLTRLFRHISAQRRRQFIVVLGLTVLSSFAEFATLGAVIPLVSILTQPDRALRSPIVATFARALGIEKGSDLVVPIAIAFAMTALFAGGLRLSLLWLGTRLGNATGTDLSIQIYARTLHQPYRVHVARSSSEVISGITQKVGVATTVLISTVATMTSSMLFLTIFSTLIFIDPVIASIAVVCFGGAYGTIAWMTRRRNRANGHIIARQQTQVVKALQEGLGAIRDVLLDGTQEVYTDVYRRSRQQLQRAAVENTFINEAPRFVMESMGMALVALFVLVMSRREGGVADALPTIAAMALGAQRLLPLMQQFYGHSSVLIASQAALSDVVSLLDQPLPTDGLGSSPVPMQLDRMLECRKLSFRYHPDGPWILRDVDLLIPRGSRVGIIGSTGSGKSTLVDLLMGLLEPTRGHLLVDGREVNDSNRRAWQRSVAHVPQSIFLTDASIEENIALGVPSDKIDRDRVRRAATQARLAEFIESSPEGYRARVGERGVRLSGGQRQRIGIARALYKQADVLIFDEATSALDSETEQSVMGAMDGLSEELTIIIIAHRVTTLRRCGTILRVDGGCIAEQVTYGELIMRDAV